MTSRLRSVGRRLGAVPALWSRRFRNDTDAAPDLETFKPRQGVRRLRRREQVLVLLWAALSLTAIYVRGQHTDIEQHVSNRLRYHAIPVVMSVLYHGRTHDYTAFSSLAILFQ